MKDKKTHNFLVIDCGTCGFIINRTQFIASSYIDDNLSASGQDSDKKIRLIDYAGEELPLFDLYGFLLNKFHLTTDTEGRIALITETNILTRFKNGEALKKISNYAGKISERYIAVRAGNQSVIENISLREIKPYPRPLNKKGKHHGILGIRFLDRTKIQYFLDLDIITKQIIGESYENNLS